MNNKNIWELAEGYLDGTLSSYEIAALKSRQLNEEAFAAEFQDCLNMLRALKGNASHIQFKNNLAQVHKDVAANYADEQPSKKSIKLNYWRTASIAAGIAIITSLATFWIAQYNNKKMASQYSLLRRDLETYKRSQNKIIGDIKKQTTTPSLQARYTGTGFALTNDGYIATSYHVVKGADSVYIQNAVGDYYKTQIVAFNETSDVVILKTESDSFRFASYDIPYTIQNKRSLAARVYTLGFPQDEIVYNEGYISAKNGYAGDTTQFRLDIQAGPGQSGAPVVDEAGNVIGVITGKESESAGTTYAVSSEALLHLLKNLPDNNQIKTNTINRMSRLNRERQIKKLENFTCAIKVYKK